MGDYDIVEGKRILVVDDEPDVLETVKDELNRCQVITAGTFRRLEELLAEILPELSEGRRHWNRLFPRSGPCLDGVSHTGHA
jgi:hypothetical protein